MSTTVNGILSYQNYIRKEWEEFEMLVKEQVLSDNPLLNEINNHLFSSSGKKIRPLLVLLSAKACKGEITPLAMECAAAAELIHTATLLHDDVVDDSVTRRGMATVNSLFSPGASVLMGDYWLSKAIKLLLEKKCTYEIMNNFSTTIQDLAEGEMLQMLRADDLKTTEEEYYNIISKKTASLFISAIKSAAIAVDASDEVVEKMGNYAYHLGLSFQIRDDILDYSDTPEDGKDVGSDLAERKMTLPLIGALKREKVSEQRGYILSLISEIDILDKASLEKNSKNIQIIREFVKGHSGSEYAKMRLTENIQMAIDSLSILPPSKSKEGLIDIARWLTL